MRLISMNPNLDLIVAALSLAISKLAQPAVNDAYAALKNLIKKHFSKESDSDIETTLNRFEKNPNTWGEPLKEVLSEASIDRDEEILNQARNLKKLIESDPSFNNITSTMTGNNNTSINVSKNDGTVIGTQNNQKDQT